MCDRRAQSEHLGHFAEKIDQTHGNDRDDTIALGDNDWRDRRKRITGIV